ncbi:MAG: (4Fe-4S)-binding protein [Candidatus Altiarchaeales archaeon WOR_SM1_86-2]|nr:MAG: (4Fe-4S)-binding protein [Candidatus Altiarchaeales archaeon WOR_SM1_86-2]
MTTDVSKWPFGVNPDNQVDFDETDKTPAMKVKEMEPSLKLCMGCGTCTAGCTAGAFTDFNIRQMFLLLNRGRNEEVEEKINRCMLCGKCILGCPRGVNTRNVILTMREVLKK